MLKKTTFTVPNDILINAQKSLPNIDSKISINEPTGRFFYDAWKLKKEFIGTVWETIYNSLPIQVGEARIIKLDTTQSYTCHGDIDDRYHLTILGSEKSYLVDLENNILHKTITDGIWYDMDAGRLHSAVNFNDQPRYQLVVRHLLKNNILKDPVRIKIVPNCERYDHRFIFDQYVSTWLNRANKKQIINNFLSTENNCEFDIEQLCLEELESILPTQFSIL
jgi:hypothetical protein